MTDYHPSQPPANDTDAEHLRLLSIFHYVLAGIIALFSLFPMIHVFIGLLMVVGVIAGAKGNGEEAVVGGLFFIIMPVCCFILPGLAVAALMAMTGRKLQARQSHTFCMVVAAISCIFIPLGTVLGVFTLIVLNRPTVKALFDQDNHQPLDVV